MSRWFAKVDVDILRMQILSTYLTVIDYYDKVDTKYTRMGSALYGRGDTLGLLNIDKVTMVRELRYSFPEASHPHPKTSVY